MKAAILIASLVSVWPLNDDAAFDLLNEQVGIHTYNLVCGGEKFFVPTHADKLVTDSQRKAYGESGLFDEQFEYWLKFISKNGCQAAAKHWSYRGVL